MSDPVAQQVNLIITFYLLEEVLHVFVYNPFGDKLGLGNIFVDPVISYLLEVSIFILAKPIFLQLMINISSSILVHKAQVFSVFMDQVAKKND